MYEPMLARESTATMTPPSKMNPRVVVPWLGFTSSMTSRSKESTCCVDNRLNAGPSALMLAEIDAPAAPPLEGGGGFAGLATSLDAHQPLVAKGMLRQLPVARQRFRRDRWSVLRMMSLSSM